MTGEGSANPAYDDRANKRAKIVNAATGERKEVAVAHPWELSRALEQLPGSRPLRPGHRATFPGTGYEGASQGQEVLAWRRRGAPRRLIGGYNEQPVRG
ncbi:Uu.00g139710.m01.CDS01 [Anthostomella pinea]|uniref:Uu.00g139710.m01.CDS01 n=1 Tax=Anthostomella pinea TaxID=933095 RepID=A0AAI8YLG0_9PEZI|nr:Uu.00g139710.m01.CDS01 [Anthostomella pinea]